MDANKSSKPFPFNTCEVRGEIVDQPYSASINILSCIILLYLLKVSLINALMSNYHENRITKTEWE